MIGSGGVRADELVMDFTPQWSLPKLIFTLRRSICLFYLFFPVKSVFW